MRPWQPRPRPTHREVLEHIDRKVEEIMAGVDDLRAQDAREAASLTALANQQTQLLRDVSDKLSGGLSDADAEALSQELSARADQLDQLTTDQATADSGVIGSGNPAPGTTLPGSGDGTTGSNGTTTVDGGTGTDSGAGTDPSAPVASGDGTDETGQDGGTIVDTDPTGVTDGSTASDGSGDDTAGSSEPPAE